MRRLTSFTFQSIDWFRTGPVEDISWDHYGSEGFAFSEAQMTRADTLVLVRPTYDHLAGFWLKPAAHLSAIDLGMNGANKIVVWNSMRGTQ